MEPTNRRRVLRALEVTLGSGRPPSRSGPASTPIRPRRSTSSGCGCPGRWWPIASSAATTSRWPAASSPRSSACTPARR
ncbi:MAG: hypothetical protein R2746_01370 [Acidimicrobiales bacterium]